MKIERTSNAVVTVRFDDVAAGWEHWVLLRSDAHHDSPKCNRALEKRHLDEMVARDGSWVDSGDLFDAMQGKKDPRKNYDELRAEDKVEDYYGSIVKHAAEFLEPYADRCILLGKGNHEAATLKHANVDLTSDLALLINTSDTMRELGREVLIGGYGGWIRFLFTINKTKTMQIKLRYFHGTGGSAPVTKGVIQTNRQAVFLPDANVVVNGHNHHAYTLPLSRDRLTERGRQYKDIQWHGRIPGYKDDYDDGTTGYAVEGGHPPTPLGALWLHLWLEGNRVQHNLIAAIE